MRRAQEEQPRQRSDTATAATVRERRMRSGVLVLAGAVVAAAIAALVALGGLFDSTGSVDAASAPTATATVARRDLVQRSTVSGTLGYADTRAVPSHRQGTITSLPREGAVLSPGDVLYRVDERPVVLLAGGVPAWRPLAEGVRDGRDVLQLEQNLRRLGYELTVDARFDTSTADAVRRWQEALELEPTGRVELGDIVFLSGARRVGNVTAALGDRIQPGTPILVTSSTERLVTAEIDAGDQQDVAVGDKVVIDLRNGTTTTGTITGVGKVAALSREGASGDPMAGGSTTSTITFEVRPDKPELAGSLDQAPVDVDVTSTRARNALSVPVTALLALRGGRYGLEVIRDESSVVVEVTPGVYSDGGYVEIEGGAVEAGDVIVVPA